MTTCKIILTPTTKEPKKCYALTTTSAFNLKLFHILVQLLEKKTLRKFYRAVKNKVIHIHTVRPFSLRLDTQ